MVIGVVVMVVVIVVVAVGDDIVTRSIHGGIFRLGLGFGILLIVYNFLTNFYPNILRVSHGLDNYVLQPFQKYKNNYIRSIFFYKNLWKILKYILIFKILVKLLGSNGIMLYFK